MADPHEFVFEIDRAIRTQVREMLETSPALRLSEDVASAKKGVYVLYWKGKLVYAGKALHTTLKRRLAEHTRKISGRRNIALNQMTCRFLIIDSDWFVRADHFVQAAMECQRVRKSCPGAGETWNPGEPVGSGVPA